MNKRRFEQAFALPTVVITAVILMMVLVGALSAVTSVRRSLNDQYYGQLAREAGDAGLALAKECLRKNNGTVTWSASQPLRPNTDCNGGTACSGSSSCYVVSDGTVRTTFEIDATTLQVGTRYTVSVSAKTDVLQTSLQSVRYTYSYNEQRAVDLTERAATSGLVLSLDAANPASYTSGNSTWKDLSGNSNNGTLVGGVTYSTSGGGALSFGGSGYVNIPNSSTLQTTGSLTMEFWFYPTNLSAGRQNVLDKAYGGEFSTVLETNGTVSTYYGTSGGQGSPYVGWTAGTVAQNQWQHVVIVRNLSNMTVNTYINGGEAWTAAAGYASAAPSLHDVTIGFGYTGVYYNGLISTVRVYNRALSYPEIRQNFLSQRSRYYNANLTSCLAILKAGLSTGSGVYTINPTGTPLSVYCDMTTDGGGWTLVLQNNSAVTTPSPAWVASLNGNTISGTLSSVLTGFDQLVGLNYWNSIGTQLRAEVGSTPTAISHKAIYTFYLDESTRQTLTLSNQNIVVGSTAPGLYTYHNGFKWSASDADNDTNSINCATTYGNHPWWYGACWDGNFFAGGSGYQEASYWTGSSSDYYAYGSLWVR
jgi:hypothetical protein